MPQFNQNNDSIQASNKMLLLSSEAIYVFQYLALMGEPAQDYLGNILSQIGQNLNIYIPGYILGITDLSKVESVVGPLESLFIKISKTSEVGFFAYMLEQLSQIGSQKSFLCASLLLIIVLTKCCPHASLVNSAKKFIDYEAAKLSQFDEIYFDCQTNLSLLAYLKLSQLCHQASTKLNLIMTSSPKVLSLKILLSQTFGYLAEPPAIVGNDNVSFILKSTQLKFELMDKTLI